MLSIASYHCIKLNRSRRNAVIFAVAMVTGSCACDFAVVETVEEERPMRGDESAGALTPNGEGS